MYRPPVKPKLLAEGIWGDEEEERGEGDKEADCAVGVKGVPNGCGHARGGERPPRRDRAEHDTCSANAAQAAAAAASEEVP
jgi:hypothetical protein